MAKKQIEKPSIREGLVTFYNGNSVIAEQYRSIRTNIQYIATQKKVKSIVVTSSISGEGKTITIANLATVFAKNGDTVLLIDGDMRRKQLSSLFHSVREKHGLSNLLHATKEDYDYYIQTTPVENLHFLKSGPTPMNPSELLNSPRMARFIKDMEKVYDWILLDAPPIVTLTDAQVLSTITDGTILVVRNNKTTKKNLQQAKQLLQSVNSEILGFVYNDAKAATEAEDYAYFE